MIQIRWNDASYQRGELKTDEINPHCILESIGFLIKESKTHYSIGMDWDKDEETWRHILTIPKKMVINTLRRQ